MSPGALAEFRPAAPVAFDSRILRLWCWALIASYLGFLALLCTRGLAVLDDFATFWAAGRLAAAGHAAAAYDWVAINRMRPYAIGVAPFFYPPPLLLVLAPLSLLPFAAAGAVWTGAMLAAYVAAARAILPGRTAMLAALAAPPILFNLATGQNGPLTAGLLGGALAVLDTNPTAAGLLIGLLAYKPHFGVLLPFFLAVTGRWRAFGIAALTIAGLVGVAAAVFGRGAFAAFIAQLPGASDVFLQHVYMTRALRWSMLTSVYGNLRALGAGAGVSWSVHLLAAAAAAALSLRFATTSARPGLQAAALATAAFVVTPYSEQYDLAVLMVPLAFLVRDGLAGGWRASERAALVAIYAMPLLFPLAWGVAQRFGLALSLPARIGLGPAMCGTLALLIALRASNLPAAAPAGRTVLRAEGSDR